MSFSFLRFHSNQIPNTGGWDIWKTGEELVFVPTDINRDGNISALDFDRICSLVASGRYQSDADLNGDGNITADDIQLLLDTEGIVAGDIDFDGDVDFEDFLQFSQRFGSGRRAWSRGDFNCDSEVDFTDFLALSANFGHQDTVAAQVPEPSCWTMLITALVVSLVRRRGRYFDSWPASAVR